MKELLIYNQVSFDTVRVVPQGKRPVTATFFDVPAYPYVDGSDRVTELEEKVIVQWLMTCPAARQIILEELGLQHENTFHAREVVQPFYAQGMGDIDLVICHPLAPNQAIALECKRVKVESINKDEDRITKLQKVAGGVHQANELYDGFAFFQTYLAIITEVAASEQDDINIPNRGIRSHTVPQRGNTKETTFRQIVEFPGRDDLHESIGIVFIEIVQPSRLGIATQATIRVCVYRRAAKRDQLDSVTNRIKELMG